MCQPIKGRVDFMWCFVVHLAFDQNIMIWACPSSNLSFQHHNVFYSKPANCKQESTDHQYSTSNVDLHQQIFTSRFFIRKLWCCKRVSKKGSRLTPVGLHCCKHYQVMMQDIKGIYLSHCQPRSKAESQTHGSCLLHFITSIPVYWPLSLPLKACLIYTNHR